MPSFAHLLVALGLLPVVALPANDTSEPNTPDIRLDVDLVLVPVNVTDRRGASVTGLERAQFRIYENKIPQQILSFGTEEVPASIGIVLDLSGSMKGKLSAAALAIHDLLESANKGDEAFLLTFADRPDAQTEFSSDWPTLESRLMFAHSAGRTALIDSIWVALDRMKVARNPRRALVIISDGMDNFSRHSRRDLMRRIAEEDVQIYTMAVFDAPPHAKAMQLQEERRGIFLLESLAAATGGLHFVIRRPDQIHAVAGKIGDALRSQYVLGYYPNHDGGREWRSINVKVDVPNLRVSTRSGYYPALPE